MECIQSGAQQAPWIRSATFSTYWTYSYITHGAFYAMIPAPYHEFYERFVQNWMWWADGWVPYFHDPDKGIPSTRLASALIDKAARKITESRVLFRNTGKMHDGDAVNPSLEAINKWADESNFQSAVKKAVKYAVAGGTSLMRINKGMKGLWCDALRIDQFLPTVGPTGEVVAVDCFLQSFTDIGIAGGRPGEGNAVKSYNVIEHRCFADYTRPDGTVIPNAPLVSYEVKRVEGSITNGDFVGRGAGGRVAFRDLPTAVKKAIGKAYAGIFFDTPTLLPFVDHLGVELVKFTDGITSLPSLPFGESLLAPIISYLMAWDYYSAAANTDMYLGRGRVLLPAHLQPAGGGAGGYNEGYDSFQFTKVPSANPEGQAPVPLQFSLRAAEWTEIRTRIIQDISINTGLTVSSIASFMASYAADARTAREIATEDSDTAAFVEDKRSLMGEPINRILALVCRYKGLPDTVAIRWSGAGVTDRYALASLVNIGLNGGFISRERAVRMINFDDDTQQVAAELKRIKEDQAELAGRAFSAGEDYQ